MAKKELLVSLNAEEKNCQGSVAAHTNNTRGIPLGTGAFSSQPMNHMAKMVRSGRKTPHKIPIAVCLYRTRISRHAKK